MILDSSVLIAADRGKLDLEALLRAHGDEVFQIAAITAAELLHGCERANTDPVRERRRRFVKGVIRDFGVAPLTLADAREHARLWALLENAGRIIGPRDREIAATALAMGFLVATRNVGEFGRVPRPATGGCRAVCERLTAPRNRHTRRNAPQQRTGILPPIGIVGRTISFQRLRLGGSVADVGLRKIRARLPGSRCA